MGTGYTRQSTYTNGDIVNADDTNLEFNQLLAAFSSSTGHTHDGTATEGGIVTIISDATQTDKVEIVTGGAKTTGTHQVTGLITADVGVTATTVGFTADAGDLTLTTGNVVLSQAGATVDSRDLTVDGTKLDTIETSATADQTDAEIKTAYENNANTNEFSDTEQTKLAGIETSATADQTGAEIKTAYEAEANAFTDAQFTKLAGIETAATADQTKSDIDALNIDADTLDSIDSTSFLRSDVTDIKTNGSLIFNDNIQLHLGTGSDAKLSHTGTITLFDLIIGDLAIRDNTTERFRIARTTGNVTLTGTVDGRDVATDGTKLDGIESGATAEVAATESVAGIVERATQAEVDAGSDTTRYISPATLASATTTGSLINVEVITATGTFTATAGATTFIAYCTSGGGGGGAANDTTDTTGSQVAGGGGGGSTSWEFYDSTEMGATAAVTIGIGGTGGVGSGGGVGGGISTFNPVGTGATITGDGGSGGDAAAADGDAAGRGGSGGVSTSGRFAMDGGTGGFGHINLAGSFSATSGDGGTSFWGNGGTYRIANGTGNPGVTPGSGGSGGANINNNVSDTGGAGAAGIVVVYEYK